MTDSTLLQEVSLEMSEYSGDLAASPARLPSHSSHSVLSRKQGLLLLQKLTKDADYRNRYERNPEEALAEVGIPAEQIANLPAECVTPGKLADMATLEATRRRLAEAAINDCLSMKAPLIRLD